MKVATFITMTIAAAAVSVTNAEQGSTGLRQELREVVKELKEEKKNKDDAPEKHLELLILDENKDPVLDVDVDVGEEVKSKLIKQKLGHLASGTGKLTVYLEKATNLADEDGMWDDSDPYVSLHLYKGTDRIWGDYGTQKSTTKNEELNPVWDETFEFTGIESLDDLELEVDIMDSDTLFDDTLGSFKLYLDEMNLSSTYTEIERVFDDGIFSDSTVYLKIKYSP